MDFVSQMFLHRHAAILRIDSRCRARSFFDPTPGRARAPRESTHRAPARFKQESSTRVVQLRSVGGGGFFPPARLGRRLCFSEGVKSMIRVVIPTLNAASQWTTFVHALSECVNAEEVLIVDSSSTDGTPELARAAGFRVHSIERSHFSHGGTRQLAVELLPEAEILVFLTQDAIPADRESIRNLVDRFEDPTIGVVYGRQLPKPGAGAIEAHARLFNYCSVSYVHDLSTCGRLGFKAAFASNSFSAYRRSALLAIGGFRPEVIMGEDTLAARPYVIDGLEGRLRCPGLRLSFTLLHVVPGIQAVLRYWSVAPP